MVAASMSEGETIYIRVADSSSTASPKPFLLNVDFAPYPPDNDDCSSAAFVVEGTYSGTLVAATNDGGESCSTSSGNADVWYQYTAPGDGELTVTTCGMHDLPGLDLGEGRQCRGRRYQVLPVLVQEPLELTLRVLVQCLRRLCDHLEPVIWRLLLTGVSTPD